MQRVQLNLAKISLRWVLVIPFVLQTVGATALVGYLSYRSGQQAVENLANQLLRQTSERVSDRLDSYLQTPQQIVAANHLAVDQGTLQLNNLEQLQQQLWQQMILNPSLGTVGFWSDTGTAIGYIRIRSDVVQGLTEQAVGQTIPPDTILFNEINADQRQYFWIDPQGKPTKLFYQLKDDFRSVPWYVHAKRMNHQGWTPISLARVIPVLQMVAIAPLKDTNGKLQGFFTANYFLPEISLFLHQLQFSPSGHMFIMERSGELVATSVPTEASGIHQVNGKPVRLPAIQSQDLETHKIAQQLLRQVQDFHNFQSTQQLKLNVDGQWDFVQITPYQDQYGLDWLVVTVIPESDFMTEIQSNTRTTVLLCLLTLGLAIASGFTIANRLTTQISRLNQVSRKLAAGDLTQQLPTDSAIAETQGLAQSFNQMAEQLRQFFQREVEAEATRQSEARFQQLAAAVPGMIYTLVQHPDGSFAFDYVSSFSRNILELEPEQAIADVNTVLDQIHPDDRAAHRAAVAHSHETLEPFKFIFRNITPSGQIKWLEASSRSVKYDDGSMVWYGILLDISDRKNAELALQKRENQLQRLATHIVGMLYQYVRYADGNEAFTYVSPKCREIYELEPEELLGNSQRVLMMVHPEDLERVRQVLIHSTQQVERFDVEFRLQVASGRLKWLRSIAQVELQSNGDIVWDGLTLDVTELKHDQEALRRSEEQLRLLTDAIPAFISYSDTEQRYQFVNKAYELQFGLNREQIVGRHTRDIIGEENYALSQPYIERALVGESVSYELTVPGQPRDRYLSVVLVPDVDATNRVQGYYTLVVDLSERRATEIALKQSETRFLEISDSSPANIYILVRRVDGSFYFEHMSRAIETIHEIPVEKILENARVLVNQIHPEDQAGYEAAVNHSLETLQPFQHEWRIVNPSGKIKWLQGSSRPKLRDNGEIAWYGVVLDITASKTAEVALQRYERIVSATTDAISLVDRQYRYQIVNQAYLDWNGKSYSEIVGHSVSELMGEDVFETVIRPRLDRCLAGETVQFNDWFELAALGRQFLSITYAPYLEVDQTISGIVVSVRNITPLKQAEEALRQSEKRFREIAETVSQLFFIRSARTSQFIYVNPAYERIWGRSCESLYANPLAWIEAVHPDDRPIIAQSLAEPFSGEVVQLEYRIIRPDGGIRWILAQVNLVLDEDGKPLHFIGSAADISDRKRAELALQAKTEELDRFFSVALDLLSIADTDGYFRRLNHQWEKTLGFSVVEMEGSRFVEYIHPDDLDNTLQVISELAEQKPLINFINRYRCRDGSYRWIEWRSFPVGNLVYSAARDITDRKLAEEALKQSESRFQHLVANVPGVIYTIVHALDGSTRLEYVSAAIEDILEVKPEQALEDFSCVLSHWHPEDMESYQAAVQRNLETLEAFSYEWRVITPSGKLKWLNAYRSPLERRENGELVGYGVVQDVSDRHAADRAKDEFISITSHELRTPLTAIRGSLGILETGVLSDKPETAKRMLKVALNNTERLVRLVNDILDLERLESGKVQLVMEVCQVSDLMGQAVEAVQAIAHEAEVMLDWHPFAALVQVAPDAIVQTLTNLLSNAIKFSSPGDTVRLRATLSDRTADGASSDSQIASSAPCILFSVADQGRGIPADKLQSIFGRFQQVDSSDARQKGGTGLGLAICKSIVQQHQGQIWVESELGQGSTFYFTLPAITDEISRLP